jgi:hypothetical protein
MKTESEKTPEQKRGIGRTIVILGALAVALYFYTVLGGAF